jgi:hypothetical protein
MCCGLFIAVKKSIALEGFEPVNFGSSGKQTNDYTTEATTQTDLKNGISYELLNRFEAEGETFLFCQTKTERDKNKLQISFLKRQ